MSKLNKNWNSLIKAKPVYDIINPNISKISVEPLERGFGLTLGNALRRILLSSIQGAAITFVKIAGVEHEFSPIEGVKEDLIDIILNLKSVAVKMHIADKKTLKLNVAGPCVVTASMITTDHDVEILNPNHIICTLDKGHNLEMEIICETGKGYIPASQMRDKELPIGMIAIDALFNPVRKVEYKIENTRIGQVTDYDRLMITLETNGATTPELAIALAARILQDQVQLFINFEEKKEEGVDKQEELSFDPILLERVDGLELSVRSYNCLKNDNIIYLGDLVTKSETDILKTQNFGRKSLNEIKAILANLGLRFGMILPGWPPINVEELSKKHKEPSE